MNHYQENPFGSARFATPLEVRGAFRGKGGLPMGFHHGRQLFHDQQAGALLIGGAGSGKFTTVLSHLLAAPGRKGEPQRVLAVDPKGEMAAVIGPGLVHMGAHVYYVNPYHLHGLPNHSLNIYSHLKPDAPALVADTRRAARTLLPESGGGDARFFEQKAQNWADPLIRGLVHRDGSVSPRSLHDLISMIRAEPEGWAQMAETMAALGEPDLDTAFREMLDMAKHSRKTYDSVLSEITNAVAFMNDPALQQSFVGEDEADFTLDVLTEDSQRPVFVFLMMPAELIEQNAPLIRQCFSTLRTLKQRKPGAPTVNLVIDEAAQLGRFPELSEFYAIGRGFGLCPLCVYQDLGQIRQNLGPTGAMTLQANADVEIYLGGGLSDLETAQHLSRKLGQQTLAVDDPLTQARAAKARREALHGILFEGRDALKTGIALRHLDMEMAHKRKQARALMSPDEILTMPANKALIWASGYGIRPFLADKVPYYTIRRYAGRYFPNPYFDRDMERVKVRGFWGARYRRVICEAVPTRYRDFPQYRSGEWRFIKGYRPKT
ncbi:type IV secretory system conjugative DNA transfer family protein [Leisingera caerulea]|uniref:type IV secretory system conjugative DNA transfer family protein n=1 Tax=Leisingera caerulea TaxID=506591 RepID=UPI000480214B|nr:type IV secretory system conjugative DNA transfer family protein [Leisingera caerulea]